MRVQFFLCALICFFSFSDAFAWEGDDYDKNVHVEIRGGNLVRTGQIIQFYDYGLDQDVNAKVVEVQSIPGGKTKLDVEDINSGQVRTLYMQAE